MRHPKERRGDGGFALPVAVLALVTVGVLVTGGFYMAQQESRIGIASQTSSMAFYIAEQGMNEVLADWSAARYSKIPFWQADTVIGSIPQGSYTVSVHRLTDLMYFVESEGTVTMGGKLAGATRRLGMIARVQTAWISPPAALTTRGVTDVRGTARVSGTDEIPAGWTDQCDASALEDRPGIITDENGSIEKHGAAQILGNPDTLRDPSVGDSTFLDYGDLLFDDLVELAQADGKDITSFGGTNIDPRPSLLGSACDMSDALNWGEPWRSGAQGQGYTEACVDYFPLIYHRGDPRLNIQGGGRGQGILLVGEVIRDGDGNVVEMKGDLNLRGDFTFLGIIIVMGQYQTQGGQSPNIMGGVMAGNAQLECQEVEGGQCSDQIITGGSQTRFSSCAVEQAILNNASLAKARPLTNRSWVDLSNIGG